MQVALFVFLVFVSLSEQNNILKENNLISYKQSSPKLYDAPDSNNDCPNKQAGNIFDLNTINGTQIQEQNIYGCYDTIQKRLNTKNCNLLLYQCIFENITDGSNGGAIYLNLITNSATMITNLIEKCQFKSCNGKNGGAIYLLTNYFNYEIKLIDNLFLSNEASENGGSIYIKAQILIIKDCRFINNHATKISHHLYMQFGTTSTTMITNITVNNNLFEYSKNNDASNSMIYLTCNQANGRFYFNYNTIKINQIPANPDIYLVLFDVAQRSTLAKNWDYSNNCITPYDSSLLSNEEDKNILQIDFESNFVQCEEKEPETSSESDPIEKTPTEIVPTSIVTPEPTDEIKCPNKPSGNIYDFSNEDNVIVEDKIIYGCDMNFTKRLYTRKCNFLLYGCKFESVQNSKMGGAIYMNTIETTESTKITNLIERCQFISCKGNDGGSIYISTKLLCYEINLINNVFINNQATGNGGAVYFRAQVGKVENCKFINNHANKLAHDLYFEFGSAEIEKASDIRIQKNSFEHSEENDINSSLILLACTNQYEKYYFNENTVKINPVNLNANVHMFLFNVTAKSTYANEWDYSNNCISPYDEFLITNEEDKDILKIDFESNFHKCEEEPETSSVNPSIEITNEPSELPPFISLDKSNCTKSHRCTADNKNDKKVFVQVLVTDFIDFINESDGGAIYIINCGFECSTTKFKNCVSNSGGGGGIYISNSLELENEINLVDLYFEECKAVYGAAIYVNSVSKLNQVTIKYCKFISNSLIESNSAINDNKLIGGSAIFISVKVGRVIQCIYKRNKGTGGAVKIYNQFETSSKLLHNYNDLFLIKECSFYQDEKSSSSIYYISGNQGSQLEIKECKFIGKLDKEKYYIDGKLISIDSPKFLIKLCKFEDEFKAAKTQLIVHSDIINMKTSKYYVEIIGYSGLFVIAIIVAIYILIRKSMGNKDHYNNSDSEEFDVEHPITNNN